MIVREKNCIDLADAGVYQLQSQLWWCIDKDSDAAIGLDQSADASSLVARISRPADLAIAPDLGDAKAGPRPEERQLQTVSTFRRLVVPGMSNGTPAVTMMRSPLLASSRLTTTSLVCSIISS